MAAMPYRDRNLVAGILALGTGAGQFLLFFPDNTMAVALSLIAAETAAGSMLIGAVGPRYWPVFSIAGCWGGILAGVLVILGGPHPGAGLLLVVLPIAVALTGGALGAMVRSRLVRAIAEPTATSSPGAPPARTSARTARR
jgi:hypothetical protein